MAEYKHIVRIANTDLKGELPIGHALLKIKGIGFMFANVLCKLAKIDDRKKTGSLTDEEIIKLDSLAKEPLNVPEWLFNRRKDPETGKDIHLIGSDLKFNTDNDIKLLRKIKCYKGVRHSLGLPVRGQRTKSNFRKSKSKGKGGALGVKRKK